MNSVETAYWRTARHLLHFVGICGAGKTTLSKHMVDRCRAQGGVTIGTLDWDPHVQDESRVADRAFRRDLDLAMIADPADAMIHREIVNHSLQVIENWKASNANLVVVDRFIESYDYLPSAAMCEVQSALKESGFIVSQALLVVGLELDRHENIAMRLQHTKEHRPSQWWTTTPQNITVFAEEEAKYQAAYRAYCAASPFGTAVVDTAGMQWDLYEQAMVDDLMIRSGTIDWTDSMNQHAINAHSYFSPSSKLGMARPGFSWFAMMPGKAYQARSRQL